MSPTPAFCSNITKSNKTISVSFVSLISRLSSFSDVTSKNVERIRTGIFVQMLLRKILSTQFSLAVCVCVCGLGLGMWDVNEQS